MTVEKQPILPHMIRRVPEQFSWLDHRLVREKYIDQLSHQASALYLFLVTVSDNQGLSYYSEKTLSKRLNMDTLSLAEARSILVQHRLVAYRKPLYQVLALEQPRELAQTDSEATSLGQILQQLAGGVR
ncbi:hypothetical protein [Desulfopila sp. IMCC35008]|uniref:hypothetical protein n=1 Tax=Desulfopila sp. IMCC35008 TaxID=2653858 RepID=UPI0013D444E9|nr:hypothetical protein [Desulfopila sp. IMCC35008]